MKKRTVYWLCALFLLLSAILIIYDQVVVLPRQAETFSISPILLADTYIARPLLALSVGVIAALAIIPSTSQRLIGLLALLTGCILIILYGSIVFCHSFLSLPGAATGLLIALVQRPFLFLIPGFLVGFGLPCRG